MQGISSISNNRVIEPLLNANKFKWKLGNGESIYFWEDWWWGDGPLASLFPGLYPLSSLKFKTIAEFLVLWIENGRNLTIWQDGILPSDLSQISQMNALIEETQILHQKDTLIWLGDKSSFTSKALQKHMVTTVPSTTSQHKIWSLIWGLKVPPKIRIFL